MAHKVLFLGTPEFAEYHLRALIKDSRYEVVGVVSQPDRPAGRKMILQPSPVKKLAIESGIRVLTPESAREENFLSQIQGFFADCVVVVAYGQILPKKFLEQFPNKVINVHASLLPRWRGAAPIQRAVMAGDEKTGVSLQVMVHALDAGDLIDESEVPIEPNLMATELHDRLMKLGATRIVETLSPYLLGKIKAKSQDTNLVTYAKKIEKSEAQVDWSLSSQQIYNSFRGLSLGPGIRSVLNKGQKLKFTRISPTSIETKGASPGEVLEVNTEHILVACGKGALQILELQPESRTKMSVSEFVKGYEINRGMYFA